MKKNNLLITLTILFFIFSVKTQLSEDSVYLSSLNNYTNPLEKVRKELIDKILKSLPNRKVVAELKMALAMRNSQTEYSLNEAESAYLIFKWIIKNIDFDCLYQKRNDETTTYNIGKGSFYGISHIFITMCKFLGLKADYIEGYTLSNIDNNNDKRMTKRDYGWNSVIIDNKYYLVDSIIDGAYRRLNIFVFKNDNYFCPYPEFFIRAHLPLDNKWQLLKKTIDLETFISQANLYHSFFEYGFKSIKPDKSYLNVNNELKIVLINENPDNILYYSISLDRGLYLFSNIKERTEIYFIFNQKREYQIRIYSSFNFHEVFTVAEYIVNNEIEKDPPLHFPEQYNLQSGIKLIEPLYSPLKRGETINFKILFEASDKLVISDNVGNITLKKDGNIFTGQYFVHDEYKNYVSITYLAKNGDYNSLFFYHTY